MRLVEPTERKVSKAVFKKTKKVLHLGTHGTSKEDDTCTLWEVEDPLDNSVTQMMIHYDYFVHGLSVEMEKGPRTTLGSHLGDH